MSLPLTSLLVKPAGPDCPLDCAYCFYLEKEALWPEARRHRMSLATLEALTRKAFADCGGGLSFVWQGGEPGLMGLDFFRQAVTFQKMYGRGKEVSNAFQTSGVHLDAEWARFFKRHAFLVGLSLDGPEALHDAMRRDKGGRGTWARVRETARMLLREGVAVNALATVNAMTARHPEDVYGHLKELGFEHLQFIPIVETDREDPSRASDWSVSDEAYGEFLVRVFDCWRNDFKDGWPTVSVRFFDSVFYHYAGMAPPDCTLMETCGTYLVVEHDGSVYPCDFFVEGARKLGDVHRDGLRAMLNSPEQLAFGREKARLDDTCLACPWLRHCRGGCPKDRIRDPRDHGHFHFCGAHTRFFEHADPFLKALAARWKAARAPRA